MKLSLYTIEQTYLSIVEELIENGGELTPSLEAELNINKEELQNKGICYGFMVKELEMQSDTIDIEIKRLQALKKTRTNTIDKLKNNLSQAMQMFGIEELKTAIIKINFRKSESVEIEDLALLDSQFIKVTTTKTADKIAIKEAIKGGENVQGAVLQTNSNLQIK